MKIGAHAIDTHLTRHSPGWVTVQISREVSMHWTACGARARVLPLALSILCGAIIVPSSRAQAPDFSSPTASPSSESKDQQKQSAGVLLTVPLADYGQIAAQNATKQKNVNLLHLTQVAIGGLNTQVATISI